MGIEEILESMMSGMRQMRVEYHLTSGEAIEQLRKLQPTHRVTFDYDEDVSPGDVDSYRGYYEDLAVEPTESPVQVSTFLSVLEAALGETFTGYKGGDFVMDKDTPLWVAKWGDVGRAVTGLHLEGRGVVLETKEMDND